MATYYANKVILNVNGVNTVPPKLIEEGNTDIVAVASFTTANTLANGDTIQLCDVPAGAKFVGIAIDSDPLDSGTPAVTFTVGDSGNNARYLASSTLSQAGGFAVGNTHGAMGYQFPAGAPTRIVLYVTHAAGGAVPANGNAIRINFTYNQDP